MANQMKDQAVLDHIQDLVAEGHPPLPARLDGGFRSSAAHQSEVEARSVLGSVASTSRAASEEPQCPRRFVRRASSRNISERNCRDSAAGLSKMLLVDCFGILLLFRSLRPSEIGDGLRASMVRCKACVHERSYGHVSIRRHHQWQCNAIPVWRPALVLHELTKHPTGHDRSHRTRHVTAAAALGRIPITWQKVGRRPQSHPTAT